MVFESRRSLLSVRHLVLTCVLSLSAEYFHAPLLHPRAAHAQEQFRLVPFETSEADATGDLAPASVLMIGGDRDKPGL